MIHATSVRATVGLSLLCWACFSTSLISTLSSQRHALKSLARARLPTLFAAGSSKMSPSSFISSDKSDLFSALNEGISQCTGEAFKGSSEGGGFSGGGGASVGSIKDTSSGREFFYKSSGLYGFNMLQAEFLGIREMHNTNTIKVPRPICYGTSQSNSFAVFEKLSLGGRGSATVYAEQLAAMHRCTSENGQFGFHINNTIGATFQPNDWMSSWADFYDRRRLGHMLDLCRRDGLEFYNEIQLREKVHSLLSQHDCAPSLVHGDLWSGNQGFTTKGEPVIYDPATYYGDREVDIAMTKLFGLNSNEFYTAYDAAWPRPEGWEIREKVYNLYHILNHYVLFGGGYASQAQRMIDQIILY